jgi:hypothetical protein
VLLLQVASKSIVTALLRGDAVKTLFIGRNTRLREAK